MNLSNHPSPRRLGILHFALSGILLVLLPALMACGGGSSSTQNTPPAAPVITSFSAAAGTITAGGSTLLTGVFANGTGVITPGPLTVTSGTGVSVSPASTTTYTLTVTNSAGTSITRTATVTVQGAQAISGVAAAGAANAGTVTLKDSSSPAIIRQTAINLDGTYSVSAAGLTPPFMLQATGFVGGQVYSVCSAAVAADINGNVNITPLTDLIVANLAGQIASDYFSSGAFQGLTGSALAAQTAALTAKLGPVLTALGVGATVDLLHMSFNTDHTGLDAVLDVLSVTTDPATQVATILNLINQSSLTDTLATGTVTGTLSATGVAAGVTTIQDITARFNAFSALFATSMPTLAQMEAVGLFNTTGYLSGGMDLATWVSNNIDSSIVGVQFQIVDVAVASVPSTTSMWVSFSVTTAGRTPTGGATWLFTYDATSGHYLAMGDQQPVAAQLGVQEQYNRFTTPALWSGILLSVNDPANYLGTSGYATLAGPGLASPVKYYKVPNLPRLTQDPGGNDQPGIPMTDAQIDACPLTNLTYTITLYDAQGTQLNSFTTLLAARPLKSTELTAASFVTVTSFTPNPLQGFNGGTITANWTTPSNILPGTQHLWIEMTGPSPADLVEGNGTTAADNASGSCVFPASDFNGWSVTHAYCSVDGQDLYGRTFEVAFDNF